jgi:hypothetical protein
MGYYQKTFKTTQRRSYNDSEFKLKLFAHAPPCLQERAGGKGKESKHGKSRFKQQDIAPLLKT